MRYRKTSKYLGKDQALYIEEGLLSWDRDRSVITLNPDSGTGNGSENASARRHEAGDDLLYHLDNAGNRIEGALATFYQLTKDPDWSSP